MLAKSSSAQRLTALPIAQHQAALEQWILVPLSGLLLYLNDVC